jgi:flagellar export protein FliJ
MKPRAAWPILVKRAKEHSDACQLGMSKAREQMQNLLLNRQKMEMLYHDYLSRSREAERKAHTISQTQNYRAFIQQLQTLMTRLDIDLQKAQAVLDQARARYQEAQLKQIKLESLMEQDLEKVRQYQQKREQREMDAAGVMLYNLKH